MKLQGGQGLKQLRSALDGLLVWEEENWNLVPSVETSTVGDEVQAKHRDAAVGWMSEVNSAALRFHPETLVLGVSLLDHFLDVVRMKPKYLKCVAVSCLFVAAKTLEEDEAIPSTYDLVAWTECQCSVSDVLRMERIVLDKLQWNFRHCTALDFLHTLHAMLLMNRPQLLSQFGKMTAGQHLSILTHKLIGSLANHRVLALQPSRLAAVLLGIELQLFLPDSYVYVAEILASVGMSKTEYEHGQQILIRSMGSLLALGSPFYHRPGPPMPGQRCSKRKVAEYEDDFYDGIKRLYGEDTAVA